MTVVRLSTVYFALFVCAVFLTGCTNPVVLGKVYDGFGSQSAKRFKAYAAFDTQQEAQIEHLAASYHSWHRSNQLSSYAALLRQVVDDISVAGKRSIETTEAWWESARGFGAEMRACNPLNNATDLLVSLTDEQVQQVAAKLRKEHDLHEEEYRAESVAERNDRRAKTIRKWATRAGASFTQQQFDLLQKTLTDQNSLGAKRFELRRVWLEEFIALLGTRDKPPFKKRMVQHINSMWQITENAYPEQWAGNEQLWKGFLQDYINLQSDGQREKFINKALKTAATLDVLSGKEVTTEAVCHSAG